MRNGGRCRHVASPREFPTLAFGARGFVKRGAQSPRELQGIVIGPEMQEEQPRLFVQHVAVDRGHLDAVRPQRPDHGIDLLAGKYEIAGNGGFAAAGGLEADRSRHAHRPAGSICIPSSVTGSRRGTAN